MRRQPRRSATSSAAEPSRAERGSGHSAAGRLRCASAKGANAAAAAAGAFRAQVAGARPPLRRHVQALGGGAHDGGVRVRRHPGEHGRDARVGRVLRRRRPRAGARAGLSAAGSRTRTSGRENASGTTSDVGRDEGLLRQPPPCSHRVAGLTCGSALASDRLRGRAAASSAGAQTSAAPRPRARRRSPSPRRARARRRTTVATPRRARREASQVWSSTSTARRGGSG